MSRPTGVKSADRAVEVLTHVSLHQPVSLAEVTRALGMPRSSAHGIVTTLLEARWLQRSGDGLLSLGVRSWEVGRRYGGHQDLLDVARPLMRTIGLRTRETVQLAHLEAVDVVYTSIVHSPHPIRLASQVGSRIPAHGTALGKAALTLLREDEVAALYRGLTLTPLTARTITASDALHRDVGTARERGYATDVEECLPGLLCAAVPVGRTRDSGLPLSVSVSVPTARRPAGWPDVHVQHLRRAAEEIRASGAVELDT